MITVNNLGFTFTYLENFQESLPIDCLSRNHLKIGQPSCISHWKWIFRQKVKWILSPFLLHLNTFLRTDLLFWDSYNLCTILLLKCGFIFTVGKTAINPVKIQGKNPSKTGWWDWREGLHWEEWRGKAWWSVYNFSGSSEVGSVWCFSVGFVP